MVPPVASTTTFGFACSAAALAPTASAKTSNQTKINGRVMVDPPFIS